MKQANIDSFAINKPCIAIALAGCISICAPAQAKPYMIKLQLEWDETAQGLRLQRDLVQCDGTMPALVSWEVL